MGEDIDTSKVPRFLWPTVYNCIIYLKHKRIITSFQKLLQIYNVLGYTKSRLFYIGFK